MNDTFYKPLTPKLRSDINIAIDNLIEELKTCKPNVFVNSQILAYTGTKNLINNLPDGYPIPFNKEAR